MSSRARRGSIEEDPVSEPELTPLASLDDIQALLGSVLVTALAPIQAQLATQGEELATLRGEATAAKVAADVLVEATAQPEAEQATEVVVPKKSREERAQLLTNVGLSSNDISDIFDREDYLQGKPSERKIGDLTEVEKDAVLTSRLQRVEDDLQRWKHKAESEERYTDTVPYLETGFSRPEALFRAQRAGLRVELDLFTEIEFASVIPGYTDFPVGAKAELEISYVSQGRIDDVLAHLIKANRGTAQLDLHRVIEVLTKVRELKNERLEGILERAYVRTANLPGENDQTVIAKMDRKRQDRLRPQRSTGWRREELTMRTLVDAQKAKLLAGHRAREELKRSGVPLGRVGADEKKGGGAAKKGADGT